MTQHRTTPDDHYRYVDMDDLFWDPVISHWRPKGTEGDRSGAHDCCVVSQMCE